MVQSLDGRGGQPVTTFRKFLPSGAGGGWRSVLMIPFDWSLDDQRLLVGSDQFTTPHYSLYWLSLGDAPQAEKGLKQVASDPKYSLWQAKLSPNGRWIAFIAANREEAGAATIAVIPSGGAPAGQWNHITDAHAWADKPRWSPDGKLLYFVQRQATFLNVWAVRFDPEAGKPTGPPFQVTSFDRPGRQYAPDLSVSELSVSSTRLVLPIMENSGSVWILDNVDR